MQITFEVIPFQCHIFLPVTILLLEAPLQTSSCHLLKGHIINFFTSISAWNQCPFKSTFVLLNRTQPQMLNLEGRVVMEAVVSFFVEYTVSRDSHLVHWHVGATTKEYLCPWLLSVTLFWNECVVTPWLLRNISSITLLSQQYAQNVLLLDHQHSFQYEA